MSPHAANSLVHDLVQMAQAMEQLPIVQAELAEWQRMASSRTDEIIRLNADLAQSRTYAATLEQRVHDLEVARDDAELSFLEADERTSRALDFVKALFGNAGALIQALEPPKAAAPQADSPKVDMTELGLEVALGYPSEAPPVAAQLDSHPVGEGTVSTDPIVSLSSQPSPAHAAPIGDVEHTTDASQQTSAEEAPPVGPYHGKYYIDVPNFLTLSEWLAGGGTEFDYHYRHHSVNRY